MLDPGSVRGLLPGGEFRVILGTEGMHDRSSNICCVRKESSIGSRKQEG